ncbi:sugar kinase [soil metagenome]
MAPTLIVVGDVMLDVSVAADRLATGGDVHGDVRVSPGGSGANAAVWAAAAGARVRLFGRVGDDLAGRLLRQALAERRVEPVLSVDGAARTGAMLVVREVGERSMVADRGANASLTPEDLPDRLEADAVLVSAYLLFDPGSEAAAREALRRAVAPLVAVDAASWPLLRAFGAERFLEATSAATVLLANHQESFALTGLNAEESARALSADYAVCCIKLGAEGAIVVARAGARTERAPSPTVEEVDPTGAGDAFDGAFLAAFAGGASLRASLETGCLAGSNAAGTASSWPAT